MAGIRIWVKILLFISSFSPLALIWGFKFKETILFRNFSLFYLIIFISALSILSLIGIIEFSRKDNNPQKLKIRSVEDLNNAHIEYLLTYVFAFLPTTNVSIASFIIFIIILLTIYLRSNLIYVNPILSLLFYDVVKLKTNEGDFILISRNKDKLIKNEIIRASILSKEVMVETR